MASIFAPAPNSGALSVLNDTDASNQSAAVFGQVTWHVTDSSRLVLGARYNDDQLTHKQTVSCHTRHAAGSPAGQRRCENRRPGRFLARDRRARHRAGRDGVRQFRARDTRDPAPTRCLPGRPAATVFVDPEIPTSYEAGIKSQWLDNRLRLNGAAYYSTFKDFQASAQVPAHSRRSFS